MKKIIKAVLILLSVSLSNNIKGQTGEVLLTKAEIQKVLTTIKKSLLDQYVDLDLANRMIETINLSNYESYKNPDEFAQKLTSDLQTVSNDKHLKVNFEPERIAHGTIKMSVTDSLKDLHRQIQNMKRSNFGFTEVKILQGNIGYLNLQYFAESEFAKETLESSMAFLSNSNAIIIDLRENGGGVPSTVKLLSSYFFKDQPVLLNTFYNRATKETEEFLTEPDISGKRLPETPLYILTSKNSFSAAEAFTYNLKHLGRAVVIGETTKGGANRTKRFNINDNFSISIPYVKAIHPVTQTNWEGVGVEPTIETPSEEAYIKAYIEAINKTMGNHSLKIKILNSIGYSFLNEHNITNAISIFKANTELYPSEANTWDSLGEAYLKNGENEKAIDAYKKALALNPNLDSAKKAIENLK